MEIDSVIETRSMRPRRETPAPMVDDGKDRECDEDSKMDVVADDVETPGMELEMMLERIPESHVISVPFVTFLCSQLCVTCFYVQQTIQRLWVDAAGHVHAGYGVSFASTHFWASGK